MQYLVEDRVEADSTALEGWSALCIALFVKMVVLDVGLNNVSALVHLIKWGYLDVGDSGKVFERVCWL